MKVRKKIYKSLSVFLALLVIFISAAIFGCEPEPVAEPEPEPTIETGISPPGAVTKVKAKWSGGDLDFTQTDGTVIMGLDGTNGDTEIVSATITGGTATALTITTGTITTLNASGGTLSGTYTTNSSTMTSPTLTLPVISSISNNGTLTLPADTSDTLVGRATTDTLTNKTLTSPTISGPTITGTPVIANHASGSSNISAGGSSVVVTHGMSGTPTRIFLTYAGDPGAATANATLFWSTANSTKFTINSLDTIANNTAVNWLAFIADE